MNSSVRKPAPRAMLVVCSDDELRVSLIDGRWLSVALAWFPRLAHASPSERAQYELLGDGEGIYWPKLDEDISVAGLIAGQPSIEFKASAAMDWNEGPSL